PDDLDGFVQLDVQPTGLLEREPFGVDIAVDGVRRDLSALGVFGARGDVGDVVADVSWEAHRVGPTNAVGPRGPVRIRLNLVGPGGLWIGFLERAGEVSGGH